MEDEKLNLCNNLIYFRKKNNYTQIELAKKIGYSNKNISKWENGEITPDIFLLHTLCDIYNITLDELFNGEKEGTENRFNEEIEKYKKMKQHITLLSILLFSFVILGICTIVSTVLSSYNIVNKFTWLVYPYGIAVCSVPLYIYFKIYSPKRIVSIVFLLIFILSTLLSIFYSTNCSSWLFVVTIPLFFIIYFYSNLMDVVTKFIRIRKIHKKNHRKNKN